MRLRILRLHRCWYAGKIFGKIKRWQENEGTSWMFWPGLPEDAPHEGRLMEWLRDGVNGEFKKEKY